MVYTFHTAAKEDQEIEDRLPLEKERPSVEEKGNDWLPILESHACYWEPIFPSSLLKGRSCRKVQPGNSRWKLEEKRQDL